MGKAGVVARTAEREPVEGHEDRHPEEDHQGAGGQRGRGSSADQVAGEMSPQGGGIGRRLTVGEGGHRLKTVATHICPAITSISWHIPIGISQGARDLKLTGVDTVPP